MDLDLEREVLETTDKDILLPCGLIRLAAPLTIPGDVVLQGTSL